METRTTMLLSDMSGVQVTGKDRARFFKRPLLPASQPVSYIRYANVNLPQAKDKAATKKKCNNGGGGGGQQKEMRSSRPEMATSGTQTVFRDSGTKERKTLAASVDRKG
jgi:hypothetical protein